jgi:cardiolipin synthase
MKTVLGTIIDPLADKILMTTMTVTLAMEGVLPGKFYLSFPYFST